MTPRQAVIGADVLAGLIVLSVAAALGNLAWHAMMPTDVPRAIITRRAPLAAAIDIQPILALAPFGATAIVGDGGDGAGLTLRGVVMTQPASLSSALIGGPGPAVVAYRTGERLSNGAVVAAIARDSVTLDLGGRQVRLGFPHRGSGGVPVAEVATDSIVIPDDDARPGSVISEHAGAATPSPSEGAAAIRALIPPSVSGVGEVTSPVQNGQGPPATLPR